MPRSGRIGRIALTSKWQGRGSKPSTGEHMRCRELEPWLALGLQQ